MKINNTISIIRKTSDGSYVVTNGTNGMNFMNRFDSNDIFVANLYDRIKATPFNARESVFVGFISSEPAFVDAIGRFVQLDDGTMLDSQNMNPVASESEKADATPFEPEPVDPVKVVTDALGRLMDFFSEFQFEPNFRFVNTLAHKLTNCKKSATEFCIGYFELTDNPYVNEIREKMKSAEFKKILDDLKMIAPTSTINNRFALYYGSAGTGKTTIAQQESNGKCVVCNASMLPSDLMEDFVFSAGNPTFQKSALWESMENGTPIVLDEINLLPFDSLRFLQGILDGKKSFDYKGHVVNIADGFKVIGTMNLTINGSTFGLPEPLIDRAMDIQKFKLTAEQLSKAIF